MSRLHDSVDDLGILVERDGLNDMTWLESNDGSGTPQALGLNLSTPELEMFFKRMDYNGDGSVQLPELVHFLEGSCVVHGECEDDYFRLNSIANICTPDTFCQTERHDCCISLLAFVLYNASLWQCWVGQLKTWAAAKVFST